MTHRFLDRTDAGRVLAGMLARYRADTNAVVLALPRGGVPVGYEVASALGLPLDVLVVRKLGTATATAREIRRRLPAAAAAVRQKGARP